MDILKLILTNIFDLKFRQIEERYKFRNPRSPTAAKAYCDIEVAC